MFVGIYKGATPKNLIKRQPSHKSQQERSKKTLLYDADDDFPLRHYKAIQDSETAIACLDTVVKFTRGSGFTDPDLDKKIINSQGQTFWEFHQQVTESYRQFRGCYINVKYSRAGIATDFYVLPFENCRLGIPDSHGYINKIIYNPFMGTGDEKREEDSEYYTFNPDKAVVQAEIAKCGRSYLGQVLYFGEVTPLSRFYPRPKEHTAYNWMLIEAAIAIFHNENLENSFFQSVLLRMIGDPNAPSQHPDDMVFNESQQTYVSSGKTVGQRFNEEMQKFAGKERVGTVMVQWGMNKEEWPSIEAFPTNGNTDFFNALSDRATDKICLVWNVPAILANVQKGASLGGDGNTIRVAVKLMQSRAGDDQKTLIQQYQKILKIYKEPYVQDFGIKPYTPFPELEIIDKQIWDALSVDEKRLWIEQNTPYKLLPKVDPAAASPTAPPAATQNGVRNVLYTDYPEKAKENARVALKYRDGGCGTPMGWNRAQRIADGMPLSFKELKSMYRWLSKNEFAKNKIPAENCDAVQFLAWGGQEMMEWTGNRIKMFE